MNTITIDLKNCYGIRSLTYSFNFSDDQKIYSIYSPNGVMKTSLAKTFKDLSNSNESKDLVFPDRVTKRSVKLSSGADLPAENVFVIEPYVETFKSQRISTLMVNSVLKEEYDSIHEEIDAKKEKLIKALKKLSGIKNDIENTLSSVFTSLPDSFFTALIRIETEVRQSTEEKYENIVYSVLFNDKSESFLNDPNLRDELINYSEKYNQLIDSSRFFKKGVFNHTNATTIAKNLKENGFFKAEHSLKLHSNEEDTEISTEEQLAQFIESEKQAILTDQELQTAFEKVDKKLSANKELRDFRETIAASPFLIEELLHPDNLKEKLWIYYLSRSTDLYFELLDSYKAGRERIESIIGQARTERTSWIEVVEIFNKRFSVPFRVSIGNQEQVILNDRAPSLRFEFIENSDQIHVEENELLKVLSTGEKRALYLLNIIFEVQARLKSQTQTLFIVDDIADSFDYKNKYAIIEYLKDISESDSFYQIILSHNYDFYRTVNGRLHLFRNKKLVTEKDENGIKLKPEKYQNSPLLHWKTKIQTIPAMFIACIPFARNLFEYSGAQNNFLKLTSLLHYKPDTVSIEIPEIESLFKIAFSDLQALNLDNYSGSVYQLIINTAESIALYVSGSCRLS